MAADRLGGTPEQVGGRLTFLTGGARSGKSTLAGAMAEKWPGPVAVVVTAEAGDDEMTQRIARHRLARPPEWVTIEAPIELEESLAALDDGTFAIVDCLTLWVSNLMGAERNDNRGPARRDARADDDIEELARSAAATALAHAGPVVAVTNEVGSGIVPVNELARRFRDVHGRVNAIWCEAATDAYLVVAGKALRLGDLDAR